MTRRLPATRTLAEILPKGAEGGKEFARIVDLLLFYHARAQGESITLFDDSAGDFAGLDSYGFRQAGSVGYQYKFFPSPFSDKHRSEIKKALTAAFEKRKESRLEKWILVTPQNLVHSAKRKAGGDGSWFKALQEEYAKKRPSFSVEHWGHKELQEFFLEADALCLLYYPELAPDGASRVKSVGTARSRYLRGLDSYNRRIKFVGMSVYKEEASRGVEMEHIYIPLELEGEGADERDDSASRVNSLSLLAPGARHVVLGDPGSGKSTLLKFLALVGQTPELQKRFEAEPDERLPVLVVLRRYADALKSNSELPLVDHIVRTAQADFGAKDVDEDLFTFYLETGRAILCFDGLDELPSPQFKETVRERIRGLLASYPGNTCLVTSRIVGYDAEVRFDPRDFRHHRVARLRMPEIDRFVTDWYAVREKAKRDREDHVKHLLAVLHDEDNEAIRELARNPLLLTIIALVHRIDAVLPDERVVLYQKCTETLLNTWHTWKFRDTHDKVSRNRTERRNRQRMEAIAYWMHERSVDSEKDARAVVPREDLEVFLAEHVRNQESAKARKDEEPEEIAERFLDFVTDRAGLLIEVGDQRFSFVHLTFQEYLAAAHVQTAAEKEGVEGLWKRIEKRAEEDRWQEVIRLLLASLRSGDTRASFSSGWSTSASERARPLVAACCWGASPIPWRRQRNERRRSCGCLSKLSAAPARSLRCSTSSEGFEPRWASYPRRRLFFASRERPLGITLASSRIVSL